MLGQGTFGQVVQCRELSTNNLVAVKVIKRHRAFTAQGEKEINTLKMVISIGDKERLSSLFSVVE